MLLITGALFHFTTPQTTYNRKEGFAMNRNKKIHSPYASIDWSVVGM
jgi:hypothetical protein